MLFDLLSTLYTCREKTQNFVARFLVRHPASATTMLFVANFSLSAAIEYGYRVKETSSPCIKRDVPFQGFGSLETVQCKPVVEVYKVVNETAIVLATAFFQLSSVKHIGGSDTLAQVPLQCLHKKILNDIVPNIVNSALFSNPPLDPFPLGFSGQCEITFKPSSVITRSTTGHGSSTKSHTSIINPARYIVFIFQHLNPKECSNAFDFIMNHAAACESSSEVSQIDAGKAFLVIALIVAAIASMATLVCAGAAGQEACKSINLPSPSRWRFWLSSPKKEETPCELEAQITRESHC